MTLNSTLLMQFYYLQPNTRVKVAWLMVKIFLHTQNTWIWDSGALCNINKNDFRRYKVMSLKLMGRFRVWKSCSLEKAKKGWSQQNGWRNVCDDVQGQFTKSTIRIKAQQKFWWVLQMHIQLISSRYWIPK